MNNKTLKQEVIGMIEIIDEDDIGILQAQKNGIIETQANYFYNRIKAVEILEVIMQEGPETLDDAIEKVKNILDNLL